MSIIGTLRNENYNIEDTEDENVKLHPVGNGYKLKMINPESLEEDPEKWHILKDGVEDNNYSPMVKKDVDKFIKVYKVKRFELADIDELKTTNSEVECYTESQYYETVSRAKNQIKKNKPKRAIVGLTPRLGECGKIKIGKKGAMMTSQKGNQFRPPEKFDHFLVTTMDKENDDFKPDEVIMKKLGGNTCREIPVRLPYDDPTLNFNTSYAYYDSAACKCRGDGETALTSIGEVIECDPENCPNVKSKKCKPNGVLSVILDDAPRVGGVYKFRTTGWNSINNIYSSMEFIRGLTNGMLAGLPLLLTLTPKHTTIPGKNTPTTIYMVNLEYRGSLQDMVDAIKQTMSTRALMQYSIKDFEKLAEETLSLPEAPDECKEIVAEFYPEAVDGV